jgi:hypothetical protein
MDLILAGAMRRGTMEMKSVWSVLLMCKGKSKLSFNKSGLITYHVPCVVVRMRSISN